jgi:2-methylcitrate dehydratase PrpD
MTVTTAPTTIRDAVAAFAATTRFVEMPDAVQGFGRLLFVDTLGALLGGLRYPPVRRLAHSLTESEPAGSTSSFARLMTLGTAATWLDADSGGSFHPQGHRLPPVPTAHPAPHILPALLDAAAELDLDDASLLEVFVIAAEVGMRSGVASSLRVGLHPHGVHGPGAAALATALVRGVPDERLGDAYLLGSCLPLAATLDVPVRGGTVRNAWTGLGSYYGAVAADLVAAGGGCDDTPYRRLFDGAVCTDLDDDLAIGDLGRRWTVLDSYLKPYACARWIHPALDAARLALDDVGGLPANGGIDPGEVERVEVETFAFAASLSATTVTTDMQARFSLPYALAAYLADGVLDAGTFLPDGLGRPAVAELAHRVVLVEDPAMSAALPRERPATVTVHLRDGRRGTGLVRTARGNPDQPMTSAQVAVKFRGNVGDLVAADLVEDVVALVGSTAHGPSSGHAVARLARVLLEGL